MQVDRGAVMLLEETLLDVFAKICSVEKYIVYSMIYHDPPPYINANPIISPCVYRAFIVLKLTAPRFCHSAGFPSTTARCDTAVRAVMPPELASWCIQEAVEGVEAYVAGNRKKSSIKAKFPVDEMYQKLLREVISDGASCDPECTLFLMQVLEYLAADILKLAGNFVAKLTQEHNTINRKHIEVHCIHPPR